MLGVFDSGIGGLTVVKAIKKKFPQRAICYFGDIARVPYGNKSREIVQQYSRQITDFFISEGIDEIVIACNTASAYASQLLKATYPTIKFFDVISPVIRRMEIEASRKKVFRVGLIGTKGTIASGAYTDRLAPLGVDMIVQACPLFVPLVEEHWWTDEITKQVAERYLSQMVKKRVDAIILGCTHYPLLIDTIRQVVGPGVKIISSAQEVAQTLPISDHDGKKDRDRYYFSDWTDSYQSLAEEIIGCPVKGEIKILG